MHTEDNGNETHVSKTEARAGTRTKVNRNALVGGLILVLIAFLVIVGFGFFRTDRTGADEVNNQSSPTNAATQ